MSAPSRIAHGHGHEGTPTQAAFPSDSNIIKRDYSYPGIEADIKNLVALREEYHKIEATFPDEWRDYGPLDPLHDHRVAANACAACNSTEHLSIIESEQDAKQWVVCCANCNRQSPQRYEKWRAWVAWNRSDASVTPPWRELPYFFLSGLDASIALDKMDKIYHRLNVTTNQAKLEYKINRGRSRSFHMRLEAYRKWAKYALRLIKSDIRNTAAQDQEARTKVDPTTPFWCRDVGVRGVGVYSVPRRINRIDEDEKPGWEVETPTGEITFFEDGDSEEDGIEKALAAATAYLRAHHVPSSRTAAEIRYRAPVYEHLEMVYEHDARGIGRWYWVARHPTNEDLVTRFFFGTDMTRTAEVEKQKLNEASWLVKGWLREIAGKPPRGR